MSESDKVSPTASDVPSGSSSVAAAVSTGGNRFSKEQKSVLRVWYNANKHDPYPSNKQKDLLATQTGLTRSVSDFLVLLHRAEAPEDMMKLKSLYEYTTRMTRLTSSSKSVYG